LKARLQKLANKPFRYKQGSQCQQTWSRKCGTCTGINAGDKMTHNEKRSHWVKEGSIGLGGK